MYQDAFLTQFDDQIGFPVASNLFKRPETAFSAELQHLFRSRYVNVTSGVGFFDINGNVQQRLIFAIPIPEFRTTSGTDLQHVNGYIYSLITPVKALTLTAGVSVDSLQGNAVEVGNQTTANPKAGIIWEPIKGTTFRAAAFRMLKRTLITDQTLEPTQVAGFNQFFDDANGTTAWRYGAAVDQQFTRDLYAGVEASKRELEFRVVNLLDPTGQTTTTLDATEHEARGYVFWTPHPWVALRAEYSLERFREELPIINDQFELTTHRLPFGVNFFHPSGVSTSLTATYWNQFGRFQRIATGNVEAGHDTFWTLDAAIGYRLPQRYGLITVGATNLLDEKFRFFDRDGINPIIQPTRMVFAKITLAFP
jgi:hypothetical protein